MERGSPLDDQDVVTGEPSETRALIEWHLTVGFRPSATRRPTTAGPGVPPDRKISRGSPAPLPRRVPDEGEIPPPDPGVLVTLGRLAIRRRNC